MKKTCLLLVLSLIGFVSYSQEIKKDVTTKSITVSPTEFHPTIGITFNLETTSSINVIIKDKDEKIVFNEVYQDVKVSFHKLDLSELPNDDYTVFCYSNGKIVHQEKIKKKIN